MLRYAVNAREIYDSAPLTLDKIGVIFKKAVRGVLTARIHSGDPSIYGAINEQMRLPDEFGIAYGVIPGIVLFRPPRPPYARN